MSKEETDREFLDKVNDIRKKPLRDRIKAAWKAFIGALGDIFKFIWFLICFAFGTGVIGAGVYAAYQGWHSTHMLGHVALSVAGASAITLGFSQLWKTVIKKK